jgi:ABC-type Mn2+/Zn2+ transport system ATPase subunit
MLHVSVGEVVWRGPRPAWGRSRRRVRRDRCALGLNGAGKTTLVSIVASLRRADAGIVEVDGLNALSRSTRVRQRIGLAPQETGITRWCRSGTT